MIWDALVVGAGPAGTLAAERLVRSGHRVLLLDAGPRLGRGARVPEVDRRAWPFSTVGLSFDWYRVRAVGGRALIWGGWAYRFPEQVFRRGGWPYGAAELAAYYDAVEKRLRVVEGRLDERYVRVARDLGVSIVPKHGALVHREAWTPLRSGVAWCARTHQVVLRLDHRGGRAVAAPALDLRTAAAQPLAARAFILAASPIETARILLDSALGRAGARIGRGLVDHMVASFLLIEPAAPPPADGRGPFPGAALVEGFVNRGPGSERPYPGSFSVELSGPMSLASIGVERMVPGDEVDRHRATLIHALGELHPHRLRYVDLDPARRDLADRSAPRLHLRWSTAERRLAADMKRACIQIADALAIPGSRVIPFVDPLLPGAGHEAGTCAMGTGENAACDPWGRVRALENVWVADAGALPTAGDRHPTLTVLAHALRAADDAARFLSHADH